MVKDPWSLYAYWELDPQAERAARRDLQPHEVAGLQTALRVYDVTGGREPQAPARDVALSALARSWSLRVDAPDREFIAELGLRTASGRFLPMARSNRVRTPRGAPSTQHDPGWDVSDETFEALRREAAEALGRGSPAGSWTSAAPRAVLDAAVWLQLDADLVLHGRADPRAMVRVDGQPVPVRRDGTFSVRLNLPEGSHRLTVEVTAPDGQRTRTVTPVVSRTGLILPPAVRLTGVGG
jgi:hypothetical protein